MNEQRQTTICAGDIVQTEDGVQWRVYAVLRESLGWLSDLVLERNDAEGRYVTRSARPSDVTLVGVQLTLRGETP